MTIREDFIEKAKLAFGKDLKWKEDNTMTSFYLHQIKQGNGFFWIHKEIVSHDGYIIELQKVKSICDKILKREYGGYPGVELISDQDIPKIISLLKEIKDNFYDRYSYENKSKKEIELIELLKKIENIEWYISERKYKDLLEEVNELEGCENINITYLKYLIGMIKKEKPWTKEQ